MAGLLNGLGGLLGISSLLGDGSTPTPTAAQNNPPKEAPTTSSPANNANNPPATAAPPVQTTFTVGKTTTSADPAQQQQPAPATTSSSSAAAAKTSPPTVAPAATTTSSSSHPGTTLSTVTSPMAELQSTSLLSSVPSLSATVASEVPSAQTTSAAPANSGPSNSSTLIPALSITLGLVAFSLILGFLLTRCYRKSKWPFNGRRFAKLDDEEKERMERSNVAKWDPSRY